LEDLGVDGIIDLQEVDCGGAATGFIEGGTEAEGVLELGAGENIWA